MLPAPAQGAIMVVCREEDLQSRELCKPLNHPPTMQCTHIEKDFLRSLMGGCSTPISALATIEESHIHFKGSVLAPDGSKKIEIDTFYDQDNSDAGKEAAQLIISQGGKELLGGNTDGKQ